MLSGLRTTIPGNEEKENRVKQVLKAVINGDWCHEDRRQDKEEKRPKANSKRMGKY